MFFLFNLVLKTKLLNIILNRGNMEYLDFLKASIDELEFKCYFCKSYLYLMGIRGIANFTDSEIIVYLKKKKFSIQGENLQIEELSKNAIRVKGSIQTLSILK